MGYLGRTDTKIGTWAGPGPSAKHKARSARHGGTTGQTWLGTIELGPAWARSGPGRAARLLIYSFGSSTG